MRALHELRCTKCRRLICRCYLPDGAIVVHKCQCNQVTTIRVVETATMTVSPTATRLN